MGLRSPSLEAVIRYLADYARSGRPNPATLEDLLTYMGNRGLRISYHQLLRRLRGLEERGLVKRVTTMVVCEYRIDGKPRHIRVRKTLWLLRSMTLQHIMVGLDYSRGSTFK